ELAGQAEQLQSTIAFFRLGEDGGRCSNAQPGVESAVKQLRGQASAMSAALQQSKKAPASAPSRSAKKIANGGFAFALDDGGDQHDAAFKRG
ncbi:MAG: methyl-accepting chemotaxis protein, partial [Bosea sp. (in: a-proteobacteria)]